MIDSLPEDVAAVLGLVLNPDEPAHVARVCSWSDDVEANLAAARIWLQPPSGTRAGSTRQFRTLLPPQADRHHTFKFR